MEKRLKRYLVFIGEAYYALAGMGDYKKSFNNLEDAIKHVDEYSDDDHLYKAIFDKNNMTYVYLNGDCYGGFYFMNKEYDTDLNEI